MARKWALKSLKNAISFFLSFLPTFRIQAGYLCVNLDNCLKAVWQDTRQYKQAGVKLQGMHKSSVRPLTSVVECGAFLGGVIVQDPAVRLYHKPSPLEFFRADALPARQFVQIPEATVDVQWRAERHNQGFKKRAREKEMQGGANICVRR